MDFSQFARDMDQCWREQRFDDLANYIASDVVVVAPNGDRVKGRDAAVDGYREFMKRCDVRAFDTSDYSVTERGEAAIVEYAWRMQWSDGDAEFDAKGRETLVLSRRDGAWRVVWRMQLS